MKIEKTCETCGKKWMVYQSHSMRKFCSYLCAGIAKRRDKIKKCVVCGGEFHTDSTTRRKITCSIECFGKLTSERNKKAGTNPIQYRDESKWLASLQTEENRLRNSKLHLGAVRSSPLAKRFAKTHWRASHFWVKSPLGDIYKVDNVRGFVNSNTELFFPEDVVWVQQGKYRNLSCRASNGLSSLVKKVGTRNSWKGWTLANEPISASPSNSALTEPPPAS